MKSFLKTFFASTLGVLFGMFIVSLITVFIIVGMFSGGDQTYIVKDNTVFKLKLSGTISDKESNSPLDMLLGGSGSMAESDIVSSIRKAKENPSIKGIYLKMEALNASFASASPIRAALIDFKESGKFVIAYGEIYHPESYLIASVADKVILNPAGTFSFEGIGRVFTFYKNQYDMMGVDYQVFKVGTFKSAVEPYIQEKMSDANRLQVNSYQNDMWNTVLAGISESRGIPVATLNEYADRALMFSEPQEIVSLGMVDELMFENEMDEYIKNLVGVEKVKDIRYASLENMKSVKAKKEKVSNDKIAILYAEGTIMNDSFSSSPLLSGALIQPKSIATELRKLKDDENVKAVVFRVNSPGGSASASEQIHNAIVELGKVKPVIVSMGTYAASGGYYISCGADAIVAEPTTITGSIGIFGLFPDGKGLAKKMGLTFDEAGTNKFSNMGGKIIGIPFIVTAFSRGLNEEESRLMQTYVEKGYDLFITRCAEGRNKTKEEIDAIGQGRVWTGSQALGLGLVDQLGGIKAAVDLAAQKAGIEEYNIDEFPKKKDMMQELLDQFTGTTEARFMKAVIGSDAYEKKMFRKNFEALEFRQAILPEFINQ